VREALAPFTEKSVFMLLLNIESYQRTNLSVLSHLVNEKGFRCLYIAVNKPSSTLIEAYRKEGINVDALAFIECSVRDTGSGWPTVNPGDLTELSITISKSLKEMPKPRYIHLDTASALYIFNQSDTIERFIHSLTRKLQVEQAGLVLVTTTQEMDDKSLQRLRGFSDRELEL